VPRGCPGRRTAPGKREWDRAIAIPSRKAVAACVAEASPTPSLQKRRNHPQSSLGRTDSYMARIGIAEPSTHDCTSLRDGCRQSTTLCRRKIRLQGLAQGRRAEGRGWAAKPDSPAHPRTPTAGPPAALFGCPETDVDEVSRPPRSNLKPEFPTPKVWYPRVLQHGNAIQSQAVGAPRAELVVIVGRPARNRRTSRC
jgi:hypothetical protein